MSCTHCGNQLAEGSRFCTQCGWAVPSIQSDSIVTAQPILASQPLSAPAQSPKLTASDTKFKIGFWIGLLGLPLLCLAVIIVFVSYNTALNKTHKTNSTATNQESSGGWQLFTAEDNSFSIGTPTVPSTSSEKQSTDDGILYTATNYTSSPSPDIAFVTVRYAYEQPVDISNPDVLLKDFLDTYINIGERELLSSQYINYGSYRALEFSAQNPTGSFSKARLLITNDQNIFFIAEAYQDDSVYSEKEYQTFVNSFRFNL